MNEKSSRVCIRCTVMGKVQGVFFRASTRNQAQQLGIVGYAKNLSNGSVEVVACGEQDALNRLKMWLNDGPSTAVVAKVECETFMQQNFSNFQIL